MTRSENYILIAQYVFSLLEKTKVVCLAVYGHPTLMSDPCLNSLNLALKNSHEVYVLPGISSLDCLMSDLMIDPSSSGCCSFEATDFLLYKRVFDPHTHLIIWQACMIGIKSNFRNHNPKAGLQLLKEYLIVKYSSEHDIVLYEAAQYPGCLPLIKKDKLENLSNCEVSPLTTLYIPPKKMKKPNQYYKTQLSGIYETNK